METGNRERCVLLQLYLLIDQLFVVYFLLSTRVALLFHNHGKTISIIQVPLKGAIFMDNNSWDSP